MKIKQWLHVLFILAAFAFIIWLFVHTGAYCHSNEVNDPKSVCY